MLNFINPEEAEGCEILNIVKDYRKSQVSRFPVDVKFGQQFARFYDTRHPEKAIAAVFRREDEKGKEFWVIESRLIEATRFTGARRHQKRTTDVKKLLRYMQDYIRTISVAEIANRWHRDFDQAIRDWMYSADKLVRDHCTVTRDELMREILRLQATGYTPQTERFAQIIQAGVPAWEEKMRRESRKVMQVYVCVNTDDTVEVYCPDKLGYAGIQEGNNFYQSIDDAPLSIQQQVAMLRMMEMKTFVPEVGVRTSENGYWVEVMGE
jgi:hypothetical protein